MKYFFLLGNNPTLSMAEISAVFELKENTNKLKTNLISKNIFLLESNKEINHDLLIKQLGGTVKIGLVEKELNISDPNLIKKNLLEIIKNKKISGKLKFGISLYGDSGIKIQNLGMEIKKDLKTAGMTSRFVTGKEKNLSSVIVEQNNLTSSGMEIVLIPCQGNKGITIARTLAVQPFKELSFMDYGRPARDDHSGMLPPKLAKTMLNLTFIPEKEKNNLNSTVLLDPFCGSGTVITEAIIMYSLLKNKKNSNFNNLKLIASDISEKAVLDTKKNIEWIFKKTESKIKKIETYQLSAEELSIKIKKASVDKIVTEPFLGPQRGKINLKTIIPKLEKLYSKSFNQFKEILKPNGTIIILFPVFCLNNNKQYFINPAFSGFKTIAPLPGFLKNNQNIKLSPRNTMIYGRKDQKVMREIIMLKNTSS
jgi:tRNA G10  N-methylase Trm11